MKYTKAFEKYWGNARLDFWTTVDRWQLALVKRIAFRAWKAGIKKCRAELIKPGRDADKFEFLK